MKASLFVLNVPLLNIVRGGGEVVVVPGTWHGKFKKEWPTEEEKKHIGKNGILNY